MPVIEVERRLCDHIEQREANLLEQLAEHVAIPTGAHAPGLDAYRRLLVGRLAALGATIEVRPTPPRPDWLYRPAGTGDDDLPRPVVVARRGAAPRVLIVGHLDTVHDPDGDFRELTRCDDGVTATGPGVVDMKGGLLVAVTALETLHAVGVESSWTVALNSDEETGSFQSAAILEELAREHELGIVVEPALPGGALAIERMGSGQFRIDVTGQSAHVGRAFHEGISAVTELGALLGRIARIADPQRGVIVNVGPLDGGHATNVVPDRATCWGNARFTDEAAGQRIAEALDALARSGRTPSVAVRRIWNRPAKPATAAVRAFADRVRCVAEDLGQTLPMTATGGVCDGNVLQQAGLPTLDTLGVRGGNLHRPDEFIEIASLVERSQLLAVLLARIVAGDA